METSDPEVIILNDLELFNKTKVYFEEAVWPKILSNINDLIETWAKQNDWKFGADEDDTLVGSTCYPNSWDPNDQWFSLDYFGNIADTDDYILADLCGIGSSKIGLIYHNNLQERKREWKRRINLYLNDYLEKLRPYNFHYDDKDALSFYIPISLDQKKLVDAWENDAYDEFLLPLSNTLESAKQALTVFDSFNQAVST
ncbi:hypothetical protein [Candidatus Igneacidithiobacillus taiwanensis]|uniref:hypothetical protein n=1 Tax=Candidatus Igneacidithiobacillus taiwanensis TaxID=1945924 RepID=UPI0028A292F9|nr:hypothetical protein [Candidatus Igneacidithiobacillus taiwanensis]